MGVKDVWPAPVRRGSASTASGGPDPGYRPRGGPVVQNNTSPGMQFTVTRPRLRNLYCQINALLSLDILPEVLDGSGAEVRQQRR